MADLRQRFPNTSWSDDPSAIDDKTLATYGLARVIVDPAPIEVMTQVTPNPPALIDGVWRVTWTISPWPLEAVKAAKLAELARVRWQRECAGIEVDGLLVATDDRAKLLLNCMYRTAEKKPAMIHRWKQPNCEVELTSTQVIALADALSAHVQACFDRELDLRAQIEAAGTMADILGIDVTAGWPL
ncbi:DUF4376 domain-containing protein [Azospirillum oleiclasticum]|nr:DUF4376 domain-containing protein [Azospirillum oleiclasticum]